MRFHPLLMFCSGLALVASASPSVSSGALLGIDVYNGNGSINWTSVKNAGYTFAFAKATEGVTFNDARTAANMANAAAAGIYIGCYDFAHPESNSPVDEANHIIAYGKTSGAFVKDGKHLMPVLDLESGNGAYTGASSLSDWVVQWARTVQTALGTTKKPILYVNGNYLSLLRSSAAAAQLTNYVDLWLASLTTSAPTFSKTTPFTTWSFWQNSWTGTVSGVSGATDLDQYNGTVAQLTAAYVVPEPVQASSLLFIPAVMCLLRPRRTTADKA